MATSHNVIYPPERLRLQDGRLIFCEENQCVCVWGCVPMGPDPDTEVGNLLRDRSLEWHREDARLGDFLEVMIYLQTAWGGYEFAGDLQEPAEALSRIEAEWERVVRHHDLTIYGHDGMLVTVLDDQPWITAAARTASHFEQLRDGFGFNAL